MVSPDERRLILGILALLLLGAGVKACRHRGVQTEVPKAVIPAIEEVEPPQAAPD